MFLYEEVNLTEERNIREIGSGLFEVKIALSIQPSSDWIRLFENPSSYKYPHPRTDYRIRGKWIIFEAKKNQFQDFISMLKNYIQQANEQFSRFEKRIKESEKTKQKEDVEKQAREKDADEELGKFLKD